MFIRIKIISNSIQIKKKVYCPQIQRHMHWQMESLKASKGLFDAIQTNSIFHFLCSRNMMVWKVQGIKVSKYTMLGKPIVFSVTKNNDKHVIAFILDEQGQTHARVYLIRNMHIHIQTIYTQHCIRDMHVPIKPGWQLPCIRSIVVVPCA